MIRKNLKAVLKRVYRKVKRYRGESCVDDKATTSTAAMPAVATPPTPPTPPTPKPTPPKADLKDMANALIPEMKIFSSGSLTLIAVTQSGSDLTIVVEGGPSSSRSKLSSLKLALFNALKSEISGLNELHVTTA